MNPRYAMFPGTFDPPTLGHTDIIARASKLYDCLHVVVADNISKETMFTVQERCDMLKDLVKDLDNVVVSSWDGATVDYAKMNDIGVLIRGIRALNDFEYEFELANVYKRMLPSLEILFLPTDPDLSMLRSSMIKEMAIFGADISPFVPQNVAREVKAKLMC
ncbi:MAG: pantetheine-phosphate adenylyltransferase [Spirochaetales bacterium]|nr:pantetheine-phosphate adenylyltransferase [Spirochaetales bacterium]